MNFARKQSYARSGFIYGRLTSLRLTPNERTFAILSRTLCASPAFGFAALSLSLSLALQWKLRAKHAVSLLHSMCVKLWLNHEYTRSELALRRSLPGRRRVYWYAHASGAFECACVCVKCTLHTHTQARVVSLVRAAVWWFVVRWVVLS